MLILLFSASLPVDENGVLCDPVALQAYLVELQKELLSIQNEIEIAKLHRDGAKRLLSTLKKETAEFDAHYARALASSAIASRASPVPEVPEDMELEEGEIVEASQRAGPDHSQRDEFSRTDGEERPAEGRATAQETVSQHITFLVLVGEKSPFPLNSFHIFAKLPSAVGFLVCFSKLLSYISNFTCGREFCNSVVACPVSNFKVQ